MTKDKTTPKSTFTKASTPEGLKRQRAAIQAYYAKKRAERNTAKLNKKSKST